MVPNPAHQRMRQPLGDSTATEFQLLDLIRLPSKI